MPKEIIEDICLAIFLIPCIMALIFLRISIFHVVEWMVSSTDWTGKKEEKKKDEKTTASAEAP